MLPSGQFKFILITDEMEEPRLVCFTKGEWAALLTVGCYSPGAMLLVQPERRL